jgi:hypothetical protein
MATTHLPTEISALISQFLPDLNWYTLESELRRILTTKHLIVDDGPTVFLEFLEADVQIAIDLDREILLIPGTFRRCVAISSDWFGECDLSKINHDQYVDNYIGTICQLLVRALGPTDVSEYPAAEARWPYRNYVRMCLDELDIPAVWATGHTHPAHQHHNPSPPRMRLRKCVRSRISCRM